MISALRSTAFLTWGNICLCCSKLSSKIFFDIIYALSLPCMLRQVQHANQW